MENVHKSPIKLLLINVIAFIFAYYVAILLHEWGHGFVAWLYGLKNSPFEVQYGGWFLLHVDENVNYDNLIFFDSGVTAALIAIAGPIVSLILTIISFILLSSKNIKKNSIKLIFAYWFLMINMVPLVQYFSISTFSSDGDTGHFAVGLNISHWWVFVPGTIFIIYALWKICTVEIIKAYVFMPVKSLVGQNILLLATLCVIFLLIYMHGFNPLTDPGVDTMSRYLSIISIIVVPILFLLCNPARKWVKNAVLVFDKFI